RRLTTSPQSVSLHATLPILIVPLPAILIRTRARSSPFVTRHKAGRARDGAVASGGVLRRPRPGPAMVDTPTRPAHTVNGSIRRDPRGAAFLPARWCMRRFPVFLLCLTLLAAACASPGAPEADARDGLSDADVAFLDTLQERTFRFFWDVANPANGLVPDRWPTKSFSSVAAIGFAIPGYAVGAERGWITRG